jgi:hypothetical protein
LIVSRKLSGDSTNDKTNHDFSMGPRNFKPLDMSKIPGYPRQMPPKYEKWLPRFTGSDGARVDYHMGDFWAFFQLHPISDDAEDLAMKLFSATLHGNARSGMMTSLMLASHLWTNWKKPFSKDGVLSWKTSQYY